MTGEQVTMGGNTYIVRGIVDTKGQLCMLQGKKGRTYPCIRIEAAGIPLSVVRQRLTGILPEGKGWSSECDLYLGIGRLLLYLPLWVMLLYLLKCIGKVLPEMLMFLVPVTGFAGVCALLLLSVGFSDDYVPTAWSDFQFFVQLFDEKQQAFLALLNALLCGFTNAWKLGGNTGNDGCDMYDSAEMQDKSCQKRKKRSGRDLNPRSLAALLLSRQMPSANSTTAACSIL